MTNKEANSKRSIILACPKSYGIYLNIIKNLEACGFDVTFINYQEDHKPFTYKNTLDRIINFWFKLFAQKKDYKAELTKKYKFKKAYSQLQKSNNKVDYSLVIRADLYPKKLIKLIKKQSNFMSGYQWDGLDRYPDINNYIHLFDRFYAFDNLDASSSNQSIIPITNFYFDYLPIQEEKEIYDLYFLGTFMKSRESDIYNFIKTVEQLPLKLNINILNPKDLKSIIEKKYFFKKLISYDENIQNITQSKIIVDFSIPDHNGLSFRIFESLQFEKKLITSNKTVTSFDFYCPENIFIWPPENPLIFKSFLETPYKKIAPNVVKQYGFTNWIDKVLSLNSNQVS